MTTTRAATGITGIGTIGIPVSDQERAAAFYRDVLGFETRLDAAFGEGERWLEVAPRGAETSIALVRSDDPYRAGIETGIRLSTEDAAADHAALVQRGVQVDGELIPYPVPMFVFRDPDGNSLIIVERPSEF